jgi:hypothetical protein
MTATGLRLFFERERAGLARFLGLGPVSLLPGPHSNKTRARFYPRPSNDIVSHPQVMLLDHGGPKRDDKQQQARPHTMQPPNGHVRAAARRLPPPSRR